MSGPNIPEAQRKTVAVKVRLPPDVAALLERLAPPGQRSEYIATLIETAARKKAR